MLLYPRNAKDWKPPVGIRNVYQNQVNSNYSQLDMDAVHEGIPDHFNKAYGSVWHSGQLGSTRPKKSKEVSHVNNQTQPITNNSSHSENARHYFQSISDNASINGLKFLWEKGRTLPERLFWAITLLVALVFSIILIIKRFNKWINSPVIVTFSTSETSIYEIPFPAITICPEVKSDKALFNYTDIYLRKEKNLTLTPGESKHFEFISVICDTPAALLQENMTLPSQELFYFLFGVFYRPTPASQDELELILTILCLSYAINDVLSCNTLCRLQNFKGIINEQVSPNFHDAVLKFDWRGNQSDTRDLFSPILTNEGVCYTFNMLDRSELFTNIVHYEGDYFSTKGKYTQWSLEKGYVAGSNLNAYPRRTLLAGVKGGLSIVFTVLNEQLDYACGDSLQGFKVTIHQPAEFPRVKQNYFRIPLDQSVVASVKPIMMTTSENLRNYSPQDRKCYFLHEKRLKYFKTYNQQNCLMDWLVNYTIESCGCVNFHMPREKSTPICSAASKECMENAKIMFLRSEVENNIKQARKSKLTRSDLNSDTIDSKQFNCQLSCYSLDYDVQTSQSNWESEETFKIPKEVNDKGKADFVNNTRIKIARLKIYFKRMQFLASERNELYGDMDFWANVGGIIGLFTGFSFITMVEVFYYLSLRLFCKMNTFGRLVWSCARESSVKEKSRSFKPL